MRFNQDNSTSILNDKLLKCVDYFTYLGNNISSTERDVNVHIALTATDRLSTTWKSHISDKIKRENLQDEAVSVLLYGCTTWTLTKY